ncbi:PASTA domain-containing protein [Streptomyces ferrugineus]|uniref:PASTA domain-containing protein n=1 Tax=Streptomyces ferrugineus TaxID=1413221 RepID=A0A7M2SUK6_9ACTN|nr:PASTA domain-containing protein [Streptomyces ferrugineus]QOV39934.1 PASTA domain-containing protein [Streptomyces ferrugineus]
MALRVFVRRFAVLLVFVLALSGCDRDTSLVVVKAVAAGVPSLAPFFDENQGLGRDDARLTTAQAAHGGLQQGDTPGLYGGSKQPATCDVVRLKEFLTDPAHERKAQAWAAALSLATDGIPGYLDRLTPVLLRHDTLVKNHDYKKGKAVPFNALLQSGIAILVDEQGLPAVKCSCGNPLRPFEGDTTGIKVEFDDRNAEWKGYQKSSVVAVRPAPRKVERLALVDVHEPDRGIDRPVGTTGGDDTSFDTRERRAVPDLAGATFGQASRRLAGQGLAVAAEGGGLPPDDARVTASDPRAGTELRFGEYVTLSVAGDGSGGTATTPPGSGTPRPTRDPSDSTPSKPAESAKPTTSSTATPSSPPASTAPPSSPGSSESAGSEPSGPTSRPASTGASSAPPTSDPPPPPTGSPPRTTSAPPTSTPVTSSAPPPATSGPATTEPATGAPSTAGPGASTTA